MANIIRNVENIFATMDQKIEKPLRTHLKNVYSCLALSLAAAAVGAYVHVFTDLLRSNILTTIGAVALLLVLYATPDNGRNEGMRFGYLMGFAFLSGLGTGPILDFAMVINPGVIVSAFFATCVLFGCFTFAALYAPNRKFLYLGGVLMSLITTMFWMTLFNLFFGSRMIFQLNLYVGLAVMCGFVLYDTQLIIEKRRRGDADYIWHSVDLFIDFLDIFRRLVVILASKEERREKKRD
jgi:FtsH-binding integral membrane protein